jgi:hypothetical protein
MEVRRVNATPDMKGAAALWLRPFTSHFSRLTPKLLPHPLHRDYLNEPEPCIDEEVDRIPVSTC